LKELVLNGATSIELKKEMIRLGMKSLRQTGLAKMKAGFMDIDEVVRCSTHD
jgi:type IV pilus assembly protein PilB